MELKELVEADGKGYCTTAVSFDGSWCSCGWSARDGVVARISLKTGKVLDVIHLSSSCSTCDRLEKLHSEGQLSWMEFLEKKVEHGEDCYLNHNGSAQIRFTKIIIIIILFHLTTMMSVLHGHCKFWCYHSKILFWISKPHLQFFFKVFNLLFMNIFWS